MDKLILKISVHIYVFAKIILGLIAPFFTCYIAYKMVNPHNFITVLFLILIWIVITLIVAIIASYLYNEIRYRFKKIDDFLYEIENYIENQKYN
jgi:predicted PurR-regulated permease PerM